MLDLINLDQYDQLLETLSRNKQPLPKPRPEPSYRGLTIKQIEKLKRNRVQAWRIYKLYRTTQVNPPA